MENPLGLELAQRSLHAGAGVRARLEPAPLSRSVAQPPGIGVRLGKNPDLMTFAEKPPDEIGPNEAAPPGDERPLGARFSRWSHVDKASLTGRRSRRWPAEGERRKFADRDEVEWLSKLSTLDPLEQGLRMEVLGRLGHLGEGAKEEGDRLQETF